MIFFYFDLGFNYGRTFSIQFSCLNFANYLAFDLRNLQRDLGIRWEDLKGIRQIELDYQRNCLLRTTYKSSKNKKIISLLKISSSVFAVIGGLLLAWHSFISGYSFIFLACSSIQMLIASILNEDKLMILYSATIFFGVDSLGIYRWLFLF